MIAVVLALLLAGAPRLELGADFGQAHLFGSSDPAWGRSAATVDPLRDPWTFGGWIAWQWRRGNLLGLRMQSWRTESDIDGLDDHGGGSERLEIDVYGPEYLRVFPWGKSHGIRFGGGLGFARAVDRLETGDVRIDADGNGLATWLRGAVVAPLGRGAVQVGVQGTYAGFSRMGGSNVATFKTSYWLLHADLGASFGL